MARSNFRTFNEDYVNLQSDINYSAENQRRSGVVPGMAKSTMHNKLFRQVSVMADAIGRFMVSTGYDALDTDVDLLCANFELALKSTITANTLIPKNMWRPNDTVTEGDIRFTQDGNGSSWIYLLCTTAGTTGTSEPVIPPGAILNQPINDGSAVWSIQDLRNALTFGSQKPSWYAPISSPDFTGVPTAPTPAANDSSTKIANTEWVKDRISNSISDLRFVSGFGSMSDLGERNGTYVAGDDGFLIVTFPNDNSGTLTITGNVTVTIGIPTAGGIYPIPKGASWHVRSSTGGVNNYCFWLSLKKGV